MSDGWLHNYYRESIRQDEIVNSVFMRNVGVILVKGQPEESVPKSIYL